LWRGDAIAAIVLGEMVPLIGRFDQVCKSTHLVSGGRDTNADTDDPFIATARHAERCYFFSNRFSQLQRVVEWRIAANDAND